MRVCLYVCVCDCVCVCACAIYEVARYWLGSVAALISVYIHTYVYAHTYTCTYKDLQNFVACRVAVMQSAVSLLGRVEAAFVGAGLLPPRPPVSNHVPPTNPHAPARAATPAAAGPAAGPATAPDAAAAVAGAPGAPAAPAAPAPAATAVAPAPVVTADAPAPVATADAAAAAAAAAPVPASVLTPTEPATAAGGAAGTSAGKLFVSPYNLTCLLTCCLLSTLECIKLAPLIRAKSTQSTVLKTLLTKAGRKLQRSHNKNRQTSACFPL